MLKIRAKAEPTSPPFPKSESGSRPPLIHITYLHTTGRDQLFTRLTVLTYGLTQADCMHGVLNTWATYE